MTDAQDAGRVTEAMVEEAARALYDASEYAESTLIGPNDFREEALVALLAAEALRPADDARAEVERLRAALKAARGWVVSCSESAQARADLRMVDAALLSTNPRSVDTSAGCVDGEDGSSASREEGLRHGG